MWKMTSALIVAAFGLALGACDAETQSDFIACESTYALCTTAACTSIPGETDTVSCACEVKTGYSVGEKPCSGKVETSKGTEVSSRSVSYTHLRAHETVLDLVCRLLLEKKK